MGADPRIGEAIGRLGAWDFSTPTGIDEGFDPGDEPFFDTLRVELPEGGGAALHDGTLEHAHRIESLLRQVRPDVEKGSGSDREGSPTDEREGE